MDPPYPSETCLQCGKSFHLKKIKYHLRKKECKAAYIGDLWQKLTG